MPDFSWIAPIRFVWDIARGIWKFIRPKKRKLPHSEILELRHKWKPKFEEYLRDCQRRKVRTDVIIRDMKRFDSYPEILARRGISPWFRIWLADTYHKGFVAGLDWAHLTHDKNLDQWRYTNNTVGEKEDVKTALVGYIPYEFIESVNWEGDEYYDYPHIFCYFDGPKREPYERKAFSQPRELHGHEYFSEVADYREVIKLSKKLGISRYG